MWVPETEGEMRADGDRVGSAGPEGAKGGGEARAG